MVQRIVVLLCLATTLVAAPSAFAVAGPALSVDVTADRHPISPAIYGMNAADPALAAELHLPVDRWGGNDKERYNWLLATKNTGRDWFFENVADCFATLAGCNPIDPAADGAYRPMIARDRAAGGTTVMQIPLIGWVAKDRPVSHPFTCGFPQDPLTPAQASYDFWDPGCGNGRETDGAPPVADRPYAGGDEIAAGPPSRTSVPFGPAEARAWVQDLVARYGDAAHGGVGYYELGNEPNLWNDSHRDVHPDPTTFDELRDKSVATAAAIKEADPTAKVIGFSEWGWTNYFCSALDDTGPASWGCQATDEDRAAHDGAELSAWYLAQMKEASDARDRRLLDDFDLHYYAQAGGYGLDASRSLWDPTYRDPSWVDAEVQLLPRMRAWVDDNFPGTDISLSEYNLTDLSEASKDSVVGTLSEADALGIFARERVDMAAMWAPPGPDDLVADAFRLYRNYDGAGGRFGDVWVRSVSADQRQLAIYGAQRTGDGAVTLAVVNKAATALDAPVAVSGFTAAGPAQVWRCTGDAGTGITRQGDAAVGSGTATSFPARSLTLLVMPKAAGPDDPPPGEDPPPDDDPPPDEDPPLTTTTPDPPTVEPPSPPADTPTTPQPPPGTVPVAPPVPPLARLVTTRTTLRGRSVPLRLSCPRGTVRCTGTLALRAGRTTLGTATLSLPAGKTVSVRLTLSRARARTVAKYGRAGRTVKATVTAARRTRTASLRLRGR